MPRSKKDVLRKRKPAVSKKTKALKPRASKPIAKAAGKSRAEGIRLFQLAGRPSQQDFVKVYGPNGPKMTWEQRAKAGVPAEKFSSRVGRKASGAEGSKTVDTRTRVKGPACRGRCSRSTLRRERRCVISVPHLPPPASMPAGTSSSRARSTRYFSTSPSERGPRATVVRCSLTRGTGRS